MSGASKSNASRNAGGKAKSAGNSSSSTRSRASYRPLSIRDQLAQSQGKPLDSGLRSHYEPLFGVGLRSVLVHDDAPAWTAARTLGVPAFAWRDHVAFAGPAPRWRSGAGESLWAHELAHVAQFLLHGVQASPESRGERGSAAEAEAQAAAEAVLAGESAFVEQTAGADYQTYFGESVVDWAGDRVDDAADWGADQLRDLIESYAPGVLELIEGVGDVAQSWIEDGFASWLEEQLEQVSIVDSIRPFFALIGGWATSLTAFAQNIPETVGLALGPLFEPVVNALQSWINPALEAQISSMEGERAKNEELQKSLFDSSIDTLEGVVGAIADGAEAVWGVIEEFLRAIPGAEEAWEWLKDTFSLAWSGVQSIVDWVVEQATDLWDWISEQIEPLKPALTMIAKILFVLSPLGPIYLLMEYGPPIWDAVTNWFSEFDLAAILQEFLDEFTSRVLPVVTSVLTTAAAAIADAIEVVVPLIDDVLLVAEALGSAPLAEWLAVLRVYLSWLAGEAREFASLTDENIKGIMDAAVAAFEAFAAFLRTLLDFFVRLVMVVLNPWLLPVVIVGAMWLIIPDAFLPPIIDFIINLMILATLGLPETLFGLGPLGPVVKDAILAFFYRLKGGGNLEEVSEPKRPDAGTRRKVKATNKIAGIAAGGGVEFVLGYVLGLFEGLLQGILDPIVLVYEIIKFGVTAVTKVLEFIHRIGEGLFEDDDTGTSAAVATGAQDAGPVESEAAAPSDRTIESLEEAQQNIAGMDSEFDQNKEQETSTEGMSVRRIMEWLWSVRAGLRSGAARFGRSMADALFEFIEQPDFQLGRLVGNVTGQVLLEIILGILTAGGWTAVTIAKPFIKVGVKILKLLKKTIQPLLKIVRRLKGPFLRGLSSIADFLRGIPGLRGFVDRIEDALRRLVGYADEVDAPSGRRGRAPDTADAPDTSRRGTDRDRDRDDSRDSHDQPPNTDRSPDGDRDRAGRPPRRRVREESKRAELRAIVRRIEPRLRDMLRRGVGKRRLQLQLLYWRLRYRLRSLRIVRNRIIARLNPSEEVAQIWDIGDELEDVLFEAETAWLDSRLEREDLDHISGEQLRREGVERRLDGSAVPGVPTTRALDADAVTAVHRTHVPFERTQVPVGSEVFVDHFGSMARTHIRHGFSYSSKLVALLERTAKALKIDEMTLVQLIGSRNPSDIDRFFADRQQTKSLRKLVARIHRQNELWVLEGARMPGSAATQRLAIALRSAGAVDDEGATIRQLFDRDAEHGPMTARGAAMEPQQHERSDRRRTREAGTAHRRRSTRSVFRALLEAAEDSDVFTQPGNTVLRDLERALRLWLRARLPDSPEELAAARTRLVAELRVFLETYPQRAP